MAKNGQKKGFQEVSSRVNSDELERGVLEYWDEEQIFKKSLEQNKEKELFTFYDGPPYATGKPHYGHVLQSSIKDTVLRYKTMRGYYVPRRVGWDTHGLPIENIVEKELGIKTKQEIEDDIEGFNAKCREVAFRYIDEFTATLKRIGRWADYEDTYATLNRDYMESEWWVFKQVWDQGLIYKDFRSTPYCTRCATPLSNFELNMAYKDKHDMTVFVKLPIVGEDNLSLLIWTTTPWTLPGNVAVAYSSDIEYVIAQQGEERFVLAKDRVVDALGDDAEIIKTVSSDAMEKYRYEQLYGVPMPEGEYSEPFRLVAAEHVTADDGTGLVHMAPAFGEEDAEVGKRYNLPVLRTIDAIGNFTTEVPLFAGKNLFDTNDEITEDLNKRGLLLKKEHYQHSYPFCWRCDSPLIYYALDTWFLKVTDLKDSMLAANQSISWIPEHVKGGRFEKGIESAPDWAISRNRFWSVPMPVWECDQEDCDERVVIGSVEELRERSGAAEEAVADLHRPYIDQISWSCSECDGTMHRVLEVLDVWFDSGSMPYSQWHYPFENKEFVEEGYPADFIAESIEMTRAWFYVLHVLASALTKKDIGLGTNQAAYKNVIASGIIFAEDGQKLSKKLKNYPDVQPTIENYGADLVRFYLLSSSTLGEPYRFSEKDMKALRQNMYMTLWNVYSFFTRYAAANDWNPSEHEAEATASILDTWIAARTGQLERDVITASDSFHIDTAARLFVPFMDDLSNWYVRRSRQRFQVAGREHDAQDSDAAFATLHNVLLRLSKLLAPFMPFVSEEMFRNLSGETSVHLQELAQPSDETQEEQEVLAKMSRARAIVSEGLALRAREGIKVRQPLGLLVVQGEELPHDLWAVIADEVNVKEIQFVGDLPSGKEMAVPDESATATIALDTTLTDELKSEGIAREIIRNGQALRRKAEYALDDRIALLLDTSDSFVLSSVERHAEMIQDALQADEISSDVKPDQEANTKLGGSEIRLGVVKK